MRISLFDMAYRTFFGRTWHGPFKSIKHSQGRSSVSYDENTYFHTAIRDNHILIIFEIVCSLSNGKKKSCGWTAFRPFNLQKQDNAGGLQR